MQTLLRLSMTAALFSAIPAGAQERSAPNIDGMAVQGTSVDLSGHWADGKNVLLVFYRMHA